jgi:hypothetical protein
MIALILLQNTYNLLVRTPNSKDNPYDGAWIWLGWAALGVALGLVAWGALLLETLDALQGAASGTLQE